MAGLFVTSLYGSATVAGYVIGARSDRTGRRLTFRHGFAQYRFSRSAQWERAGHTSGPAS